MNTSKTLIIVMAIITTALDTAKAQPKQNPFGLVYGGAITANIPGKVNILHGWLL